MGLTEVGVDSEVYFMLAYRDLISSSMACFHPLDCDQLMASWQVAGSMTIADAAVVDGAFHHSPGGFLSLAG